MRVNLCGGNACMTKQLLHGTHIGTALNKVRGERVPQGVRMQRLIDVRTLPAPLMISQTDCRDNLFLVYSEIGHAVPRDLSIWIPA